MAKFCNNGHQMDDTWTDCPYCAKTGYRGSASVSGALDQTRPDMAPTEPAWNCDPRKTVALASARRARLVGWLVALDGPQKGEDFRLREGKNAVGSTEGCDVLLRDQAVSARHASLSYREGRFVITDLDSMNGTFLNADPNRILSVELKDNDLVLIGETTFKFKCL